MARGLLFFSQRTASNLLISTISVVSPSKPRILFPPTRLRSSQSSPPVRLHCECSDLQSPPHTPDYRRCFARRMAMAGLKPHHRIAIGVSGGPDSMALCVLAAGWKADAFNSTGGDNDGFIDGCLAIIVDHGLRLESKDEADLVCRRVSEMGIRCEVTRCVWSDGRPKQGHLQEAARDMRYEIFQNVCIKHQIGVLLTAHHADDQAELFVIRLSRNSGVLGLAGMAFTFQLFPAYLHSYCEALTDHAMLVVRPLLDFSKEDMYNVCKGANQEWVEDPSNQSSLFARNRIRMSFRNFPSSFKAEVNQVISACRETRSYVDRICRNLISQSVAVMAEGYAIIDLEVLNPSKIEDICLSKFVTIVLQFVSQRHRPVRGSASKLLMDYIRTFPCKTSFTAAGCYLCAAPGSKGTKVLVCCSVNSPPPSKMKILCEGQNSRIPSEVQPIINNSKLYSSNLVPNRSSVHFLDVTSSKSVLTEARRVNIISESTLRDISLLQSMESIKFKSQIEKDEVKCDVGSDSTFVSEPLLLGKFGHFMNRFLVTWNLCRENYAYPTEGIKNDVCRSCEVGHDMEAEVRHMVESDWLYLAKLSKDDSSSQYARHSAQRAVKLLKSIPVAARRALPVLVNPQGLLLSIPSVCFMHCPCLEVSAEFKPRVPLGGGHTSFA